MMAQLSSSVGDSPGWGAAEWIAFGAVLGAILTPLTGLLIVVIKMRSENSRQHAENKQTNVEKFDELRADVANVHQAVGRVDGKVDRIDERVDVLDSRLDRHESLHHRGKRRW